MGAALRAETHRIGIFAKKQQRRRYWQKLAICLIAYIFLLALGTAVFATQVEWGPEDDPFIHGLYLSVITMTTIGFGDYSPENGSFGMRLFGVLYMLVGIPVCVSTLGVVSELV